MAKAKPNIDELPTELIPVDELVLDEANARRHGRRNLDTIKHSLNRFGQRKPLVILADRTVIAGNGTLAAVREMIADKQYLDAGQPRDWRQITHLWCTVFPGSGREARAFAIADNRTSDLADWEERMLSEQLAEIAADGDLALLLATGFDQVELDELAEIVKRDAQYAGQYGVEFPGHKPHAELNSLQELYGAKGTRSLVFDYPNAIFAWAVEQLSAYRTEHELASNADAVLAMIALATGSEPPVVEPETETESVTAEP